jgi:hypothetical protein
MNKKSIAVMLCVLGVAGVYWFTQAGDMEPPGPPAPTMVTMQEMFDEVKSPLPDTCFDNVGRYVDCGNGTVKDNLTGLVWLKDASCLVSNDWAGANIAAAQLADGQCGLTDGSSPGDWRLPTKDEWGVVIDQAIANGCSDPYVPDVVGTGCCGTGTCAFSGLEHHLFWSSSTWASIPDNAWGADLWFGDLFIDIKTLEVWVWPVRGGQ